jgi:hypothetical protein
MRTVIRQNTRNYKEEKVVANDVFVMSSVGIVCLGQAVTMIYSLHFFLFSIVKIGLQQFS